MYVHVDVEESKHDFDKYDLHVFICEMCLHMIPTVPLTLGISNLSQISLALGNFTWGMSHFVIFL